MPLRSFGFTELSRPGTQVATTSGQRCPSSAQRCDRQFGSAIRTFFVMAVIRDCALASRVHSGSCASGIHLAETDSAANQFGAPDERRRPARDISVVCEPCLPLAPFVRSRNRRAIMTTADTLPGEPNAQIISSIINLVCPQCGGRMSEFQCEGKCRRNWLAEWEWANHVTRSSRSRLRSHAARSMR